MRARRIGSLSEKFAHKKKGITTRGFTSVEALPPVWRSSVHTEERYRQTAKTADTDAKNVNKC